MSRNRRRRRTAPGQPVQTSRTASQLNPLPVATVPIITQERLRRYFELRSLEDDRERLRQELVADLTAGATVEPGELTAELRDTLRRPLPQPKLREILGDEGVDWMLEQVEPVTQRSLHVRLARRTSY